MRYFFQFQIVRKVWEPGFLRRPVRAPKEGDSYATNASTITGFNKSATARLVVLMKIIIYASSAQRCRNVI